MLQTLALNAANPVCVMTQDTARNFLAGSSAKVRAPRGGSSCLASAVVALAPVQAASSTRCLAAGEALLRLS